MTTIYTETENIPLHSLTPQEAAARLVIIGLLTEFYRERPEPQGGKPDEIRVVKIFTSPDSPGFIHFSIQDAPPGLFNEFKRLFAPLLMDTPIQGGYLIDKNRTAIAWQRFEAKREVLRIVTYEKHPVK